jgi:hypothetical protein
MSDQEKALMFGVEEDEYLKIRRCKEIPATEEMLLRVSDMIAIFRILSTMYDYDHETIGRHWMKRKNWRTPFYGDRPLDHIAKGYLALEETRRHLEALMKSYGGIAAGKNAVDVGGVMIGEIVAFNNFALIKNEDADILATMLLRVCGVWKLTSREVAQITKYEISGLKEVAHFRSLPGETYLTHWRMILMIHYAVLVLNNGNEEIAYRWMCTSNIMLKNGMTPFYVLKNRDIPTLYGLLKPLVEFMP